jgi:hypothetical protein
VSVVLAAARLELHMPKTRRHLAAAAGDSSVIDVERAPAIPSLAELADAEIAARAYSYWEVRGFQGGSPEADWYRAIDELTAERRSRHADAENEEGT